MDRRRAGAALRLAAWCLPLLAAGCMVRIDSCGGSWLTVGEHSISEQDGKLVVDGVRLEHDRWVEVDLDAGGVGQLSVETATGPIELRGQEAERCQLSVHLHTSVAGDGEVVLEDGKLIARPKGDGKVFIDGVKGSVPQGASLVLSTGNGDVLVERAAKGSSLSIDSGASDVTVRASEPASLDLDMGAGDVRLEQGGATTVKVDMGAGDVRVVEGRWGKITVDGGATDVSAKGATIEQVRLDSGTGDLILEGCTVESAQLDSGTGDLVIRGGSCKKAKIDSGTGDVEVLDGARVESLVED